MAKPTIISTQKVIITPEEPTVYMSDKVHYQCSFCGKMTGLYPISRHLCEKLSGDSFHCPFCLRNRFNGKMNRHILILSFRAIVGYYFHEKYQASSNRSIWLSEIKDCIRSHEKVGLQNPIFSYDPETLLWFVNFERVGKGRKKIRVVEVLKTLVNMLACFNLPQHIPNIQMTKLFTKYSEAVKKFYKERYRPEGKRLLIPTLAQCGVYDSVNFKLDDTRLFLPDKLGMR